MNSLLSGHGRSFAHIFSPVVYLVRKDLPLLHEFADELGGLDEGDQEADDGPSIEVDAVGVTEEDLQTLRQASKPKAVRRHVLRVDAGGELTTWRSDEEADSIPTIVNAAEEEESDEG